MSEDRLARIEKSLEELNQRLERIERIIGRLEELEKHGTLDLLVKTVEKLATSFEALADPKNLGMLAMALSVVEAISKIDPSFITVVADSIGECAARTQNPETIRMVANPPEIGGIFGLLKIINDPDVKKLLGLLYVYAKIIGGCLPDEMKPKLEHLETLYKSRLEMLKRQRGES